MLTDLGQFGLKVLADLCWYGLEILTDLDCFGLKTLPGWLVVFVEDELLLA